MRTLTKEENKKYGLKYAAARDKLAKMLMDMHDIQTSLEYTGREAGDNQDPDFELQEAERQLGIALAVTAEYATEYLEAAETEPRKQKAAEK